MSEDGQSEPADREELDRQLVALAGAGAINCGFAIDTASAEEVSRRATAALASHQPFYCMYLQSSPDLVPPVGIGDFPRRPVGPGWPRSAGYAGRADGLVFEVHEHDPKTIVTGTVVLVPGARLPVRRIGLGMTLPGIAELAERLVRESTFHPGELFGAPVAVCCEMLVDARMGRLSIRGS